MQPDFLTGLRPQRYLNRLWRMARFRWRRQLFRCLTLLLLIGLLFCLLFTFLLASIRPASASPSGHSVWLLIDQSNSLFEMGGIGSDPEGLRMDAARLFISYLGVDDGSVTHQCSLIFFGSTAQLILPLTPLGDGQRRADILALLDTPERMGWTDHLAALRLARVQIAAAPTDGQSVIILLTDGKPERDHPLTNEQQEEYIAQLQVEAVELAAANIPLFIILLANEATDADPTIATTWQPLWQEITRHHLSGRFFVARQATDLLTIYHDIFVTLTGKQTEGVVINEAVTPAELTIKSLTVSQGLSRLTLVISKSQPTLEVTVLQPDGQKLEGTHPGVRYAGQPGQSREEIWAIDDPPAGTWTVILNGEGWVTVWQDYDLAPTPTATGEPSLTPTPVSSPTFTVIPSPLPTETAVNTPLPTATPVFLAITAVNPASLTPTDPAANKTVFLAGGGTSLTTSSRLPWMILYVPGFFLAVAAVVIWRGQVSRSRPQLSGTLFFLGQGGMAPIELDSWQRTHLTLGAGGADIPLTGLDGQIRLQAMPGEGEGTVVWVSATAPFSVNDLPTSGDHLLRDKDRLTVPPYRWRYENLRWRSEGRMIREA